MKPEKILKLAIEKAVKNGWDEANSSWKVSFNGCLEDNLYYHIVFSHDFAKTFWGEKFTTTRLICRHNCQDNANGKIQEWEHHLQQMVLEKQPLLYLSKFLK